MLVMSCMTLVVRLIMVIIISIVVHGLNMNLANYDTCVSKTTSSVLISATEYCSNLYLSGLSKKQYHGLITAFVVALVIILVYVIVSIVGIIGGAACKEEKEAMAAGGGGGAVVSAVVVTGTVQGSAVHATQVHIVQPDEKY